MVKMSKDLAIRSQASKSLTGHEEGSTTKWFWVKETTFLLNFLLIGRFERVLDSTQHSCNLGPFA